MRLHSLRLYDPSDVSLVWYAKLVALHIVYRCLKLSVTWYMFSPQNVTIHWQLQLTFGIVLHFDYEWIGFSYSIIRRLRNPISWSCRPDQWCKKMIPVSQANYFCSLSLFLPNPISVFLLHLPMFLFFYLYLCHRSAKSTSRTLFYVKYYAKKGDTPSHNYVRFSKMNRINHLAYLPSNTLINWPRYLNTYFCIGLYTNVY